EFVTSTTTFAPASAWASPSPVRLLTPEEGEADTASWPRSRGISFLPMSPLPPITTIFMPGLLECRPAGSVLLFPSLFLLIGDDDALVVLRVQADGDEARLVLRAGVPSDAVQAAGRLVEGVTGLEDLGLVVVDGPLVLALQDVPERRAGMTVRGLHLARRQRHLDRRGLRLLPVQLLDDVLLGEHLDLSPAFAVLVVVCQAHPAGRERAQDDRHQGTSHDSSSERTGASAPSGNKDVEGGMVCDRLEEHSRKGGRFAEGGREAARRPHRHDPLHRSREPCQCRTDTIRTGALKSKRMTPAKLRNCSGPPHRVEFVSRCSAPRSHRPPVAAAFGIRAMLIAGSFPPPQVEHQDRRRIPAGRRPNMARGTVACPDKVACQRGDGGDCAVGCGGAYNQLPRDVLAPSGITSWLRRKR